MSPTSTTMNILANYPQHEQEEHSEEEVIDLRHYWRVLMLNKLGIISLGFVAALVAALIMFSTDNIYRSSATLLIESDGANITTIEDLYGIDAQSREYFSTQFELLKNRNLAERVIVELNLTQHREFIPEESNASLNLRDYLPGFLSKRNTNPPVINTEQVLLASVLNTFNSRLSVNPVRNTDLVKVSFEAKDPQLASDIANSLANNFIENDLEQRLSSSQQASVWLSGRMQGLKEVLDLSEQNLQGFLEREQLVNIEGVASLNIQELDELTSQSIENRLARGEAETLYRQVQQLQNPSAEELLAFPAVLNHPSMQGVRESAAVVDQQIAELSNRYGRNHPRMIGLDAEQAIVQGNLNAQVQQVLSSLENDYLSALNNEQTTLARLEQSKADLQGVNRKSFELRELEREVETNRQLYDMFFTRIRETDETNDFQTTNAIVVDPAVPAVSPSKPNRKLVVILALIGGLMLGVFLAFVRDMLNNTLQTHTDVEDRLHTPALGVVPLVEQEKALRKEGKAFMGFYDDKRSPFSESLRTIRTSITLSSIDHPYKIIEVTSSVPNEGKTTVAINLASVIGEMGKVLLIDTDMRRPSLDKSIGLEPNAPGLSNLIAGTSKLNECRYNSKKLNIAVIPAGHNVPNPLELLASNRFKSLLAQLSDTYDHIILDTPPMQAVSDSLILSTLADAVIYVVKADGTTINQVKGELSRLKKADANVIGVVLNQVDVSKGAAFGYGGYYDSYGYSTPEGA